MRNPQETKAEEARETPYTLKLRLKVAVQSAALQLHDSNDVQIMSGSLAGVKGCLESFPKTKTLDLAVAGAAINTCQGALLSTGQAAGPLTLTSRPLKVSSHCNGCMLTEFACRVNIECCSLTVCCCLVCLTRFSLLQRLPAGWLCLRVCERSMLQPLLHYVCKRCTWHCACLSVAGLPGASANTAQLMIS